MTGDALTVHRFDESALTAYESDKNCFDSTWNRGNLLWQLLKITETALTFHENDQKI